MTDLRRLLKVEPLGRSQHLLFNLLEFRFFASSERGKALFFGNPRVLMPLITIPYILAAEIAYFRGRHFWVKMGMQKAGVLVLSARHGAVYVDTLAVSPSYRRLGIGLRMLRWIEGVCRQMGEEWLEIATLKTNVPALRLYMGFGFCVFAEKKRSVILRKKVTIQ